MKNMILPLLLAAISTCAMADWLLIYKYSDADIYASPSTVERTRDKATMWNLSDSRKASDFLGSSYRSFATLVEYDCVRMTSLAVKWIYYKGQMGQGELSGTFPPIGHYPGYSPLPLLSDTPDGVAWKIACGKQ
jgi:hypothetical protein